jgi:hypothetical protein
MAIIVIACLGVKAQVSVNADGSAADISAMLDVASSNKGVLLPRMTYSDLIHTVCLGL